MAERKGRRRRRKGQTTIYKTYI